MPRVPSLPRYDEEAWNKAHAWRHEGMQAKNGATELFFAHDQQ
jgi:hypothetical protein